MIKFENMAHRSIYQNMRLAVFADIHGNLPALNAVLADMEAAGDFDLIWCLGDLAALGGQPHECLAALLQLREAQGDDKFKIIGGNTDRYLVTGERMPAKAAENANDFAVMRDGSRRMNAVFAWNLAQLDWADYDLLRQIVGRELRRDVPGYGRVIGIHAIPGDDEALALRPDSADEEAADALLDREGRLALCGHTHLALDRAVGNWRVINPGSVGLSFGNPGRAEWALLEWRDGALTVDLRRVPYDVTAALRAWQALGYPEIEWIRQRLTG